LISLRKISSGYIGSILALVSASTLAQMLAILMQLVLRRLYAPAVFGALAVCVSIIEIIVAFGTLRYENAIVLPEKESSAANLLGLSCLISVLINAVMLVAVIFLAPFLVELLNFPPAYTWWFYLIPLISMVFSFYQAINYWLIRAKAFRAISWNKMWRRGSEGGLQFIFGILKMPVGMMLGTLGGHLVNFLGGLIQMKRKGFNYSLISRAGMKKEMHDYAHFARYGAIPSMLNTFSALLPVFIINKIYNETITGYFDLSRQVLLVPVALISASIAQVFTERFNTKRLKGEPIMRELMRTYGVLLIIAFAAMIIIIPFGGQVFQFVFGKNGYESGLYAGILVFALPIKLLASSSIPVFYVFEKVKTGGLWHTIYFVAILSMLLLPRIAIEQFLAVYVLIEVLCFILCIILIIRIVKTYEQNIKIVPDGNHTKIH
jgi:O-antigen/teichoic acid export membrane protein